MARDYQPELDFAFFVVNFHYTKADYEALTPKEKSFIYKAWESKVVSDTSHIASAVGNAIGNALRKRGKKPVPLWKKKQRRLDVDVARDELKQITKAEQTEGKTWVKKVYETNGFRRKE